MGWTPYTVRRTHRAPYTIQRTQILNPLALLALGLVACAPQSDDDAPVGHVGEAIAARRDAADAEAAADDHLRGATEPL